MSGPSPAGRRCRGAADEGLACSIDAGPSSVPFATLWVHLLPVGEGPTTLAQFDSEIQIHTMSPIGPASIRTPLR